MANPNREAIIELGGRIATLRADFQRIKLELKTAEADLDRLLVASAQGLTRPSAEGEAARENFAEKLEAVLGFPTSLNRQIVAVIDSDPARQFTAEDMFAKFPEANQTSIRSALSRLAEQGKIRRVERGEYRSTRTEAIIYVGPNGEVPAQDEDVEFLK